jgi:hypothetical protein
MKMTSTLVSGGTKGADLYWAKYANIEGCNLIVWSFPSHPIAPFHPKETIIKKLKDVDFIQSKEALFGASKKLKSDLPRFCNYKYKVLSRYYFISKDVDAMYIIGKLKTKTPPDGNIGVEGDNCWPCQLFVNRFIDRDGNIPLYIYSEKKWYNCNVENGIFIWSECQDVPKPTVFNVFAGLGSREALVDPIKALFTVV